ncbi:protein YgfX [Paraburkholderia humisilvae]|uniref:protein YgfX n=1 Tax=Paraburkholderia humisilvae TaxID=627669 RepID=UPI00360B4930
MLRRSALLYGVAAGFILVAAAAVFTTLASRTAWLHAAVAALTTLVVLSVVLVQDARRRPASLKIGSDTLTAWNRAGQPVAQGRIAGFAQWSGWLLSIALVGDNGRSRTLLVTADMLCSDHFRELSVQARRAAHGAL